MKKKCVCCGFYTMNEKDSEYDICPVCFWEDDNYQTKNPTQTGANKVCLIEGRENYRKFGACEVNMISRTRAPRIEELGE